MNKIIKKVKIKLGKMDYNETGNYTHPVEIEVELRENAHLKNGELSIRGEVWKPNRSDVVLGGQCLDSIDPLLLEPQYRAPFLQIKQVWDNWHLNDMRAGSPAQRYAIEDKYGDKGASYEEYVQYLKDVGLYFDPNLDGYKYGSQWLKEELPPEVLNLIDEWSKTYAV